MKYYKFAILELILGLDIPIDFFSALQGYISFDTYTVLNFEATKTGYLISKFVFSVILILSSVQELKNKRLLTHNELCTYYPLLHNFECFYILTQTLSTFYEKLYINHCRAFTFYYWNYVESDFRFYNFWFKFSNIRIFTLPNKSRFYNNKYE